MYFDNAATSFPKPDAVYRAVDSWMRTGGAAAGRGSHRRAEDAGRMIDSCRKHLADLLDVPLASHVVFTLNCSDSLNTVLRGILRPGDRVVASMLDHNSVIRPLHALRDTADITWELAGFDPVTGLIDELEWENLLSRAPCRLAVITHASNVTGSVQDAARLAEIARRQGALVLLDAAQSAGHVPVSLQQQNLDFIAAPGHKSLLGPLGTGVLCVRPGLGTILQPLRYGGTGTESESLEQPESMPARLESGNLNLPGIAGLVAALEWLQDFTISAAAFHVRNLTVQLHEGLREIPNVRLYSPCGSNNSGIVSFEISGQDSRDVAMILDQSFEIQCRAGLHCAPLAHERLGTLKRGGTVRFSPGVFSTPEDIQSVIRAVYAVATM